MPPRVEAPRPTTESRCNLLTAEHLAWMIVKNVCQDNADIDTEAIDGIVRTFQVMMHTSLPHGENGERDIPNGMRVRFATLNIGIALEKNEISADIYETLGLLVEVLESKGESSPYLPSQTGMPDVIEILEERLEELRKEVGFQLVVETVFRRYDEAVLLREEVQPEFESAVANYIPRRSESRTKLQNALDALMRNKKAPMQELLNVDHRAAVLAHVRQFWTDLQRAVGPTVLSEVMKRSDESYVTERRLVRLEAKATKVTAERDELKDKVTELQETVERLQVQLQAAKGAAVERGKAAAKGNERERDEAPAVKAKGKGAGAGKAGAATPEAVQEMRRAQEGLRTVHARVENPLVEAQVVAARAVRESGGTPVQGKQPTQLQRMMGEKIQAARQHFVEHPEELEEAPARPKGAANGTPAGKAAAKGTPVKGAKGTPVKGAKGTPVVKPDPSETPLLAPKTAGGGGGGGGPGRKAEKKVGFIERKGGRKVAFGSPSDPVDDDKEERRRGGRKRKAQKMVEEEDEEEEEAEGDEEEEEEYEPEPRSTGKKREAKYPDGKYPSRSKRYKYDPWGEDEVDFIVEKFKEVRCGRQEQAANGSWKDVATMGKKAGILKESRSPQDVRDKIRGLIKNGKIEIDGHVLRSVTDPIEPEAAAAPEAADDDQIEATP